MEKWALIPINALWQPVMIAVRRPLLQVVGKARCNPAQERSPDRDHYKPSLCPNNLQLAPCAPERTCKLFFMVLVAGC